METEILGYDERDCGVKVIDERGHEHRLTIGWEGEVIEHGVKEYPNDPADKTKEESRIVKQVAARAKFAAHQHFEADLVAPGWDPETFERGRTAMKKLSFSEFESAFRDFYETVLAPEEFVNDPDHVPGGEGVFQVFGVTEDDEIDAVEEPIIYYDTATEARKQRDLPEYEWHLRVVATLPRFQSDSDVPFRDFPGMVYSHLGCMIRDIYRNMGEDPPPEYQMVGPGKFSVHGDDDHPSLGME